MPIVVSEKFSKSRTGSIDPNGTRSVTRIFDVVGTTDMYQAVTATGLPARGHTVEVGDDQWGVGVYATYIGGMSWSRPEGTEDHWLISCKYSTNQQDVSESDTGDMIATQGDTRATTKAVYRKNPSTANIDNPTASDIGGDQIDEGGTPTTIVSIDRRFNTTEKMSNFPALDAYSDLIGKRNQSDYEGGESGSILYLGFSWNYDSGSQLWNVNHQFAVDKQTHHAEQVAKTDPQGDVIKEAIGTEEEKRFVASHVYWVQPFDTASFGILPDF